MPIENGKLTNGIARIVNGKLQEVELKDAALPVKSMNDRERLDRYRGERQEFVENTLGKK